MCNIKDSFSVEKDMSLKIFCNWNDSTVIWLFQKSHKAVSSEGTSLWEISDFWDRGKEKVKESPEGKDGPFSLQREVCLVME